MIELPPNDYSEESNNNPESWGERVKLNEWKNTLLRKFLNKSEVHEGTFEQAKEKVLKIIDELSSFLDSLEKRAPEDTAEHYVEYYFPIIEEIRIAKDFEELNEAFRKVKYEDLTKRFFSTIKKWGFLVVKTRKGDFPLETEEFREYLDGQVIINIIARIEGFIEELDK